MIRAGSDRNLEDLLAESGGGLAAEEVLAILAGVAAAPRERARKREWEPAGGADRPRWLSLIAPAADRHLAAKLGALEAELRAARPAEPPAAERITALRAGMEAQKLDGFVVPVGDEFQGEYPARRARRLAWLSGFTGSAGLGVVLARSAALFTDGRYTLQAADQVDGDLFSLHHITETPPAGWIAGNLPAKGRLGIDPWLHTMDGAQTLRAAAKQAGGELVPIEANPIDRIWTAQPAHPISPAEAHPLAHAGRTSAEKRQEIAALLSQAGEEAVIICAPPSIAWLANLRGTDLPHTPLTQAYAILRADRRLEIFLDRRKLPLSAEGMRRLELGEGIRTRPLEDFAAALDALGGEGGTLRLDGASTPEAVYQRLKSTGAPISRAVDPCALPKARKNDVELAGMRAAHLRDGVAMARFLAWLDGQPADGGHDEMGLAAKIDGLRAEGERFRDLSFPSISATGANGAIVHYQPSEASNKRLAAGALYLIDSGAQYLDGTTDVTRTLAIGAPSDEMRERFTRVLKGHIGLARARFPAGTTGPQLDSLARIALWRAGLDYDHGTGHGVGSYLGVHEGPHGISKRPNKVALEPGMIVSDEPGYYKSGAYGMRIESLLAVKALDPPPGAEGELLGFEVLTQVPIDLRLVDPGLLDADEIAWLDAYHAGVRAGIAPLVAGPVRAWLERATRSLAS